MKYNSSLRFAASRATTTPNDAKATHQEFKWIAAHMNFTGLYFGGREIEQQKEIIPEYGINKAVTFRSIVLRLK